MPRFPVDAPRAKVISALESLGFRLVRDREHVSMIRDNPDGTRTPLTLPGHSHLKGSILRMICKQSGITRDDFLKAYEAS